MVGFQELVVAALTCITAPIILLCIYRLTLHPYAKYPGPILAKLTSLRAVHYAHTGNMHLDIERCHQKYGKFVRYRPNSIIVNSPEGYQDIYGNGKKVKKARSYKVHGMTNLIGIQDKKEYTKVKKIMQPGFSDSANREHEPKVIREIDTFIEKISENETSEKATDGWSNSKNMALWCNYLTTDVVSNVVFTTSWDLLTSTANHGITETFKTIVRLIGVLHQWPILNYFELSAILFLPHLAWSPSSLKKFSLSVIACRYEMGEKDPSIKDVFGLFSSAKDPDTGELALKPWDVRRNAANFIIAGSDTTASSIAATFFYLARNPTAYSKVAQEVRSGFHSASDIRAGPALNNCVYLRAAINESLRMAPVATQPLWREVDPGGCTVDGETIPGGLNVGASIFSLHHISEAFPDPYKWDIERWIVGPKKDEEEKERIKEMSRSFAPFSVGPRQCIAKNFALMELTLTMARVFYRLDFESAGKLGEGKKGTGWGREREEEFQFKSYFTSYMAGPMIRFRKREI